MKSFLFTLSVIWACSGCGAKQTGTDNAASVSSTNRPAESTVASDNAVKYDSMDEPAANGGKYSPQEIIETMNTVKDDVKACGNGTGVVKVKFRILVDGSIESVEAIEDFAGTETGACVEQTVINARFRPTDEPVMITYPFKF